MQPAAYLVEVTDPKVDRRKLTVVMHADMVGYSRLVGLDDAGTAARLGRLRRELIDPVIVQNDGVIQQTAGDSVLVVFDSIEGAVQAAISIQRGVPAFDRDAAADRRIRFRIGINLGDAILAGTDMHGDGVNIAVRLESACPPGGICVSRTVRDHARDQPGLRFERLGALRLKNIARPIEAFVLHFDEIAATGIIAGSRRLFSRGARTSRRFVVPASAAIALVAVALAAAVIYTRETSLPQQQEAARAEARHTEEMERLQALNATEKAMAETLAREKGIPIAALTQVLARLGETVNSDNPSDIQTRLERIADEYVALREQVLTLSGDDPKVTALRREAESALEHADFALARTRLLEAAKIDRTASLVLADKAKERALAAARSLQESARVAALTLNYREAADDLANAVTLATPYDRHFAWLVTTDQALMLRRQGREFGDNAALAASIDIYKQALKLAPRSEDAKDWARTQNGLGMALRFLGEREAEPGHVIEAIAAFRAALEEWPRQSAPRAWAQAHTSLGYALLRLGQKERATTHLDEAATAFQAAMEVLNSDSTPLEWAEAQNGLGLVRWVQGGRARDRVLLEQAVVAFRAALQERTRARDPLGWAQTESNLGLALTSLDLLEGTTAQLEEAVGALRAALEVRTHDRVPLDWAETQNNLGSALRALGRREDGAERFQEAVAAHRAALEVSRRDQMPLGWARSQRTLGNALIELGRRKTGTAEFEQAIASFRAALEEITREKDPLGWAGTTNELGVALLELGRRESGTMHLQEALASFQAALQELTRDKVPLAWAREQNNLGSALVELGVREDGTAPLEDAMVAYRAALEECTRDRDPFDWAYAQSGLSNALATLAKRRKDAALLDEALSMQREAAEPFRQAGARYELSRAERRIAEWETELANLRR